MNTTLKNSIEESKFSVILHKEANFVHFIAHGDNQIKDLIKMINKLDEYSAFMENATVLLDLRNQMADYELSNQDELLLPFEEVVKKFKSVKIADIVNDCKETAYAMLFEKKVRKIPNTEFSVFCTYESAINWLNNN